MSNTVDSLALTDPKAFLRQYKNLYAKLLMLKNELDIEKETTSSKERMQSLIAEVKATQAKRTEVYDLINATVSDDRERYVLCAHFVQGLVVSEIAESLNLDKRSVQKIQASALKSFSMALQTL